MISDKARIQVLDDHKGELRRNTSVQVLQQRLLLNTNTRLQWKLWSRIQVSKSVQRKLHSEICISTQSFFFFFLKQRECKENGNEKFV